MCMHAHILPVRINFKRYWVTHGSLPDYYELSFPKKLHFLKCRFCEIIIGPSIISIMVPSVWRQEHNLFGLMMLLLKMAVRC